MMASITMSQSARSCCLGRAFEPRANFIFLLCRDAALLRRPLGKLRQRLFDSGEALVEIFLFDFEDGHVEAGSRRNLRNAEPISPQPSTPTFLISILDFLKILATDQRRLLPDQARNRSSH